MGWESDDYEVGVSFPIRGVINRPISILPRPLIKNTKDASVQGYSQPEVKYSQKPAGNQYTEL